jgi:hypothetical protein
VSPRLRRVALVALSAVALCLGAVWWTVLGGARAAATHRPVAHTAAPRVAPSRPAPPRRARPTAATPALAAPLLAAARLHAARWTASAAAGAGRAVRAVRATPSLPRLAPLRPDVRAAAVPGALALAGAGLVAHTLRRRRRASPRVRRAPDRVRALAAQGAAFAEIARQTGLAQDAVRMLLAAASAAPGGSGRQLRPDAE